MEPFRQKGSSMASWSTFIFKSEDWRNAPEKSIKIVIIVLIVNNNCNKFYIYIYAFSRHFYPKRLTVHSGYTFFLSVCVFPGNWTHDLLRC